MDDKALLSCHVKGDQEQGWRSTCPVSRLTSISRQLFRVILLRRLHLPLPLTVRNCWCGIPHDSRAHHRRAVLLGRREGGLWRLLQRECAVKQVAELPPT